jgi:hypothetical protein
MDSRGIMYRDPAPEFKESPKEGSFRVSILDM